MPAPTCFVDRSEVDIPVSNLNGKVRVSAADTRLRDAHPQFVHFTRLLITALMATSEVEYMGQASTVARGGIMAERYIFIDGCGGFHL